MENDRVFTIGATSFVYPTGWVENVERLAGRVDDVELLLFEAENPPSEDDMIRLARYERAGLSYTVHTPLRASLASEDEALRVQGVEDIRRAIELTQPLNPAAWIVHVYLGDHEGDTPPLDLDAWRDRARQSLQELAKAAGDPRLVCVETLDYDFELLAPIIHELGLGITWDLGHFYRDHRDWSTMLNQNFSAVRVIQWHGTDSTGRDHRSLRFVDADEVERFIKTLIRRRYDGILTLEVFRETDLEESLDILLDALKDKA